MSTSALVIFVTAGSRREAKKIASALLQKKLAACVNLVAGVESHYRWQGKIESAREVLLIIKTRASLFAALSQEIRRQHSYSVPEIIAWPIARSHPPYLKWIETSTRSRA